MFSFQFSVVPGLQSVIALYMALISTCGSLVRRTEKEDPWLFILITAVFINLSYYRSDGEAEALQHPSRGEGGIETVPLEFDCHTT